MTTDIQLQLQRTPAHRRLVIAPDDPRSLAVACIRTQLGTGGAPVPRVIRAIPQPTHGIIREGTRVFVRGRDEQPVAGDETMREALGIVRAVDAIAEQAPEAVAYTGLGNVAMNAGSVAFAEGDLAARLDEQGALAAGRPYPCMAVFRDGRVSVEDCRFMSNDEDGSWSAHTESAPKSPVLAISGQVLVRDGIPVDPYRDLEASWEYPDLRHLLSFPYVAFRDPSHDPQDQDAEGRRMDFGLDALHADDRMREDAIRGQAMEFPLSGLNHDGRNWTVHREDLEHALHDKGYASCPDGSEFQRLQGSGERGIYHLDEKRLVIVLRPAVYNHHLLAVRASEPDVLYDMVIGGCSNTAGTNPRDLASDLADSGVTGAVLLDQGGDAVLVQRSGRTEGWPDPNGAHALIPSSLGRERWAALLAYTDAATGTRGACRSTVATLVDSGDLTTATLSFT